MPLYMRLGKQRGPYSKDAMPIGPFRTLTQPVNVRDLERVRRGRRGHARGARQGSGLIRNTRIDVKILGHGDLTKKLTVTAHAVLGERAREDRGRRRQRRLAAAARAEGAQAEAEARRPRRRRAERRGRAGGDRRGRRSRRGRRGRAESRTRRRRARCSPGSRNAWRVPELRRRVLFTALILALYRLGLVDPGAGRRLRRRSRTTSTTRAAPSSACSTSSRAARSRSSRSSRSGSCRTSRPRSSCSS